MKRLCRVALVGGAALVSSAHVGSPDVYYEGMAGPYSVRVIVRMPVVVPGRAEVAVRVTSGGPVTTVATVPVYFATGLRGAPPPDTATLVTAGLYQTHLWLMRSGAYSVNVTVSGAAGQGTAVVPVVAVATRRLAFERPMAIGLIGLGLFLFVGALTILRAAARESTLSAGQAPTTAHSRRGWITAGVSGIVLIAVLVGGWTWWNAEDAAYRRILYRPWNASAAILTARGQPVTLALTITDSLWRFHAPLIPDHGKLMHLFLIRYPEFDVLAHLHPRVADSSMFVTALPSLPSGHYRAFGDIVFETGGTRTLVTDFDIGAGVAPAAWTPTDSDDALATSEARAVNDSVQALGQGLTMTWTHPRLVTRDSDGVLAFTVRDAAGRTATLEPYLGMVAHAVVARDDGTIFIHLHPMGTISVAAQQALELREPADTTPGSVARRVASAPAPALPTMSLSGAFSFPYAFPAPGNYHVWVQVKSHGKILTGTFATQVR